MDWSIRFPHLGIYLEHVGKNFTVFGISIAYYGVIIAVGMLAGILLATYEAKRTGQNPDDYFDLAIIAIICSVIGARLYYVIFSWDLYKDNLWSILNLRQGGLAIYGGVIAAIITAVVFAKVKGLSFPRLADTAGLGLILGQIIGRWGNFVNGEAHGGATSLPWGMSIDGASPVHPTFLYESLWNFVGFLVLHFYSKKRKFKGEMALLYVAWYGLGRAWIEGLRTDSLYFFGLELFGAPIRTSQVLAIVSAAVAAVVLIYELKFRRHDPSELYVNRLAAHRADAGEGPGGPEKKED